MKCARLELQERKAPVGSSSCGKPWKFCQRRLVNPAHDEDPRWNNIYERFYCQTPELINETPAKGELHHSQFEDLFLSVQNLKFQGNEQQKKRQRSGFKLKKVDDGKIHRMFVKQNVVIDSLEQSDEDRSSQLTCYYYDDCVKYLQNYGRPFSSKSNYSMPETKNKLKENKATQVEVTNNIRNKLTRGATKCIRHVPKTNTDKVDGAKTEILNNMEGGTKVCFHRSENMRSLTIARAQSPESVQVIRVAVVCARAAATATVDGSSTTSDQPIEKVNLKNSHYAKKYLISNTMKNLEERVSGGSKVTLLCKTFKLSDRSKKTNKQKTLNYCKLQLKK